MAGKTIQLEKLVYKEESYKIIGILFEVHKNLGKGFSEIVYKDAIEYELKENDIKFEIEKNIQSNIKTHI